jgi:hypothetical protein
MVGLARTWVAMGKSWKGVDTVAIYRGKSPGEVVAMSRIYSPSESRI